MWKLGDGDDTASAMFTSTSLAQEPYVLSEGVQEFAIKADFPKELGLTGQPADIARYIHTLSAIDIAAKKRAGNAKPTFDDYTIAATILCRYPIPFKPPEVKDYAEKVQGAYVNAGKRYSIETALGDTFLTATLASLRRLSPITFETFKRKFFDFDRI